MKFDELQWKQKLISTLSLQKVVKILSFCINWRDMEKYIQKVLTNAYSIN